jgi:hypothetical protein
MSLRNSSIERSSGRDWTTATFRSFTNCSSCRPPGPWSVAAGGDPGDLSLLRTLEALAVGVQGKRCLWRSLQSLPTMPPVQGINFVDLEAKAVGQWEAIEERRRAVAARTFLGSAGRA